MKIDLNASAEWLDDRCRRSDLKWQRLDGNVLRRFGVKRENIEAFLWPSLVAAALWTGMPTLRLTQLWGVGVGLLCFVLLVWINGKSTHPSTDLVVQVILLSALAIAIWRFGSDQAGTDSPVYSHLLIPIVLIVALSLLIAVGMARELCRPLHLPPGYGAYLEKTELFEVRGARLPRSKSLVSLLIFIPFSILLQPLQLAWPIAIVVLTAPTAYVKIAAWITFGVMVLVLVLTAMDDRLDNSVRLLMRRFLRNAALGVTLITLALGAARLLNVTYVTTVFDSASGAEILLYFLFAYAITWWFDYWVERMIGQQLLLLIDPTVDGNSSSAYSYTGPPVTTVPVEGRRIELFGLGRFLAFCPNQELPAKPFFQAWTYEDFFRQVAASGAPGGRATPLPLQIMQRVSGYVGAIALVAAGLLGWGAWLAHQQWKNAELVVVSKHATGLNLRTLLAAQPNDAERPAVLVAASGGGTRAAVFTAAVLEGLSESKGGGHIVLGSGVSGGAAALSYFAINRPALIAGKPGAWDDYKNVMSKGYIREVIDRSTESRMVVHGRLGILLAESFERHWGSTDNSRETFAGLTDFGLITNSTLAGHFDWNLLTCEEKDHLSLAEASQHYLSRTDSEVAGGRLMMTNLDLTGAFAGHDLPYVKDHLPILIDDKDTRVERAAALSANFPPVFSNAAIDVDNQQRYWVTDGGAADNRGLEPVLYAIRDAIQSLPQQTHLPTLRVVIIDASGTSTGFSQNRGLGSALGAGAHFADQLNNEMANQLKETYKNDCQERDLQFYYVPMPNILRKSGSFGTHWMLQKYIKVDNGSKAKTFKGTDVVDALRGAYAGRPAVGDSALLVSWIKDSPEFSLWCEDLRKGMTGATSAVPATCGK